MRHKSVAGSLATTLNRFKVYMKSRGNSVDEGVKPTEEDIQQGESNRPKMGHYRTQSQTITKETTERIR